MYKTHTTENLWYNTLEGTYRHHTYRCYVSRSVSDTHKGLLEITDADGRMIFSEDITISYGGPFGPDVGDIDLWNGKFIKFIDQHESGQKEIDQKK